VKKAEIVIIGAGVVGASVAYHLARSGARDVVVLERESKQGRGSTGAATGGVRAQFETDINILMSRYSIDFFRNWDVDCGYEPRGYLFFATREDHLEYLEANVAKQKRLGVEGVALLDPGQIAEMVPGMNCGDIVGGSFGANDGFIDPLAVMRGFTEGAAAEGVHFEFDARVQAIVTSGGRVAGVRIGDEIIECEKAVVCSGAWAKEVAATAGIDLPVEPMRRQIVWARSAKPVPEGLPMVIDLGSGFHFRPAKGSSHELLFAYPDPDEPSSFDTSLDDAFIQKIRERARMRAPFLYETQVVREKCRVGLYENTPDHHAILGGCEVEGLYFANGFSGHGVMHSPATGRALAEIILDGRAGFLDVTCLELGRFAKGEMLHETAFI
jgi:sarcosine oxidase, subunit beta